MMSAKTVSTEISGAPSASATTNNPGAQAATTDAPSDFQSLLSGAAPTVNLTVAEATPGQPLAQLLGVKVPQIKAANNLAMPAEECAAGDMLKLLTESATLLPDTGDVETAAPEAAPGNDTEDHSDNGDDLSAVWLDTLLPGSLFVPQAGCTNLSDSAPSGDASTGGNNAALAQISASLLRQAGSPLHNATTDAPATSLAQGIGLANNVGTATANATSNPVTALAAALAAKTDGAERDKPTNENWMSALGDLSAKRGADQAPVDAARISTPVHDTRWADAIAHRLVMMARDGESTASLKLIPVDLGPLDIQISVKDGAASVHFGAAHQETRQVLEASIPRLREMLSAQGLQLNNATVSHQSPGKGSPERPGVRGIDAASAETEAVAAQVVSTQLLDTYA
jgi:flagellar hook-length control protein FliK